MTRQRRLVAGLTREPDDAVVRAVVNAERALGDLVQLLPEPVDGTDEVLESFGCFGLLNRRKLQRVARETTLPPGVAMPAMVRIAWATSICDASSMV